MYYLTLSNAVDKASSNLLGPVESSIRDIEAASFASIFTSRLYRYLNKKIIL